MSRLIVASIVVMSFLGWAVGQGVSAIPGEGEGTGGLAEMASARQITVYVLDADGAVIRDAVVEALTGDRSVAIERTGPDGAARLPLDPETRISWIVALKPGAGLDYVGVDPIHAPRGARSNAFPDEIRLTLRGARTVCIRAVGGDGAPLAGVRFAPWAIRSSHRPQAVNLGASFIATATTSQDGAAVFDWIPRETWDEVDTTFLVQSPGFHWADPAEDIYPGTEDVEVTARLDPLTTISGTILGAGMRVGGQPVSQAVVIAEGRGDTAHPWRARARTALDGSYTLEVAPRQTYMVSVVQLDGVAVRAGVAVDGAPVRGVDLVLQEGVLIHGRVARSDGTPVVGELVLLGVEGAAPGLAGANSGSYWDAFTAVGLQRQVVTDADGRYAFRVSPGAHLVCAVGAGEDGIHDPRRVEIAPRSRIDVRVDFESHVDGAAIATTAAPFRLMAGELFEYAFHPAARSAWMWSDRACAQCHRPSRSGNP